MSVFFGIGITSKPDLSLTTKKRTPSNLRQCAPVCSTAACAAELDNGVENAGHKL